MKKKKGDITLEYYCMNGYNNKIILLEVKCEESLGSEFSVYFIIYLDNSKM